MKMEIPAKKSVKLRLEHVHVEPTPGIVTGLNTENNGRNVMGTAMKAYPSKSKPGKVYTIMQSNDGGSYYCDCWQWKKNRTCQHLEHFLETCLVLGNSYIEPDPLINVGYDETVEDKILGVMNRHW